MRIIIPASESQVHQPWIVSSWTHSSVTVPIDVGGGSRGHWASCIVRSNWQCFHRDLVALFIVITTARCNSFLLGHHHLLLLGVDVLDWWWWWWQNAIVVLRIDTVVRVLLRLLKLVVGEKLAREGLVCAADNNLSFAKETKTRKTDSVTY